MIGLGAALGRRHHRSPHPVSGGAAGGALTPAMRGWLSPSANPKCSRRYDLPPSCSSSSDDDEHDGGKSYRREHFGFADGLSQPRIAGVSAPPAAPPDTGWGLRWWRRPKAAPNPIIQPGEFVLGYPDEDNPNATA